MKMIALLLVARLRCQVDPVEAGKKHVFELTDSNFDTVNSKESQSAWLVTFSVSTCRYCASLRPIIAKIAFDNREANFRVGEVDCHRSPRTCRLMRVHSHPTLQLFKAGRMYRLDGKQTYDAVSTFINGGYRTTPYKKIYSTPPSMVESVLTVLDVTFHQLHAVYEKSNRVVRALLSLFFGFTCAFGLTLIGFASAFIVKRQRKAKAY